MAFKYFIYSTGTTYAGTIVRESATNNPGAGEASFFYDFIIPEIQPVFLWRVDDVNTPTDIIPNTDENIRLYTEEIAPPPSPDDLVTYSQLTGITETKIDTVTGATDNIAIFTADGNLQDGGYTIPELTGLTTYTFVASGGTNISQVGNTVTISSTVPTGTTVAWGDITGTLSNQTDLQDALDDKLDVTDFNTYTGATETRIGNIEDDLDLIESDITGLTATKLDTSVFNSYTGTSQPILDAALTGVTNLGTGTTLGSTSGRDVTLKSISVLGGLSLSGDADNLIISGQTGGVTNVEWGDITGTLSNQTDLWNELTGMTAETATKLDTVVFNSYTGITETRLSGIESDIIYLSGETDNRLLITDFNTYTGATETRISDLEDDVTELFNESLVTITGATNGLTKVGGKDVELGGALTKDTVISGLTHDFTINTDNITLQSVGAINLIDANGVGGINIESDGGVVKLQGNDGTSTPITKIEVGESTLLITDDRATPRGIQYADDYSSTFQNRSLVDKAYVDAVATGLIPKANVKTTTTPTDGNIDLTGGTFVAGTIDGYTLLDGDRVLITEQTLGAENGIYVYSASTSGFTRSVDFDGNPDGEVSDGNLIPVLSGNTYANTLWVLVTPNPIIVGTTPLTFTLFSSPLDLQAGVGIGITGQTIAVDGLSLAGNSIAWTGNTFNVDITSGTLATALNSKLNTSVFNSYTGTTETRLQGIETDISNLETDFTGLTATKLDTSVFNTYTGVTETRLLGIEGEIDYISGVTDTKLDTEIFTGYTATTAANEIFLVHTGGTDLNTIGTTAVEWHEETVDGSLYEWTGGSNIKIFEAGNYEITYNLPFNVDNNSSISVGANIIQNGSVVIDVTAAVGMANRVGAAGSVGLPSAVVTLAADDVLTLATFRTGQAGAATSSLRGSILIKKKNTLQ